MVFSFVERITPRLSSEPGAAAFLASPLPGITLTSTEVRLPSQNRMGYRTNTLIAVARAMRGKFAPYLGSLK